jgi:preprotein translocase subunit SecD
MRRREFVTLLAGTAVSALLRKAALAADTFIFEVVSAQPGFDDRTGRPIVNIRLSNERPFTKLEAEKQVLRTAEIRIDGTVIYKAVIREPFYVGALQISGTKIDEIHELQTRITRAVEAGSQLVLAIVD